MMFAEIKLAASPLIWLHWLSPRSTSAIPALLLTSKPVATNASRESISVIVQGIVRPALLVIFAGVVAELPHPIPGSAALRTTLEVTLRGRRSASEDESKGRKDSEFHD